MLTLLLMLLRPRVNVFDQLIRGHKQMTQICPTRAKSVHFATVMGSVLTLTGSGMVVDSMGCSQARAVEADIAYKGIFHNCC